MLAMPAGAAQRVADDLVDADVRIIFNYSEGLLDVPSDVTVHTSDKIGQSNCVISRESCKLADLQFPL